MMQVSSSQRLLQATGRINLDTWRKCWYSMKIMNEKVPDALIVSGFDQLSIGQFKTFSRILNGMGLKVREVGQPAEPEDTRLQTYSFLTDDEKSIEDYAVRAKDFQQIADESEGEFRTGDATRAANCLARRFSWHYTDEGAVFPLSQVESIVDPTNSDDRYVPGLGKKLRALAHLAVQKRRQEVDEALKEALGLPITGRYSPGA
jgi:hypothetical protein